MCTKFQGNLKWIVIFHVEHLWNDPLLMSLLACLTRVTGKSWPNPESHIIWTLLVRHVFQYILPSTGEGPNCPSAVPFIVSWYSICMIHCLLSLPGNNYRGLNHFMFIVYISPKTFYDYRRPETLFSSWLSKKNSRLVCIFSIIYIFIYFCW
jgi:hypothetical protein